MSMPVASSTRCHRRGARCRPGGWSLRFRPKSCWVITIEAESESGVGWNYLAAINLIETRLGSIAGVSTAGAQGPMQFLPSTFAAYGQGGDINSPHDSIMAAGRTLPPMALPTIVITPSSRTTMRTNTCGRSTDTRR